MLISLETFNLILKTISLVISKWLAQLILIIKQYISRFVDIIMSSSDTSEIASFSN